MRARHDGALRTSLARPFSQSVARAAQVTTLGRIDDSWFCVCLTTHSLMSKKEVAKLTSFDAEAIKQVLIYCLGTSLQLKLPAECAEKRILNLACSARYNEMGSRLHDWKVDGEGIFATGRIDWGKVGVYSLKVEEQMVREILHIPTGVTATVAVTCGFCIYEDRELTANWSDMGAKACVPSATIDCGTSGCES